MVDLRWASPKDGDGKAIAPDPRLALAAEVGEPVAQAWSLLFLDDVDRALAKAEEVGDPRLVAHAARRLTRERYGNLDNEGGRAAYERSLRSAAHAGPDPVFDARGRFLVVEGTPEERLAVRLRAFEEMEAIVGRESALLPLNQLGTWQLDAGHLPEAMVSFERQIDIVGRDNMGALHPLWNLNKISTMQGRMEEGLHYATINIARKVSFASVTAGVGVAMEWVGFVPNAVQSEATLTGLSALFAGVIEN